MNFNYKKDYFWPFLAIFIPQVITGIVGLGQSFISMLLIGDFGIEAIAVVTFIFLVLGLFAVVGSGFPIGMGSILSISFGAKNFRQVNSDFWQGLYFNLGLGIFFGLISLGSIPLGYFMGYKDSMHLLTAFNLGALGIFITMFMTIIIANMLANIGLARYTTYISVAIIITSTIEQYFIIRGFAGYGGYGLTWAALVAPINGLIAFLVQFSILIFHPKAKHLQILKLRFPKFNVARNKLFVKNGIPISLANLSKMGVISIGGLSINLINKTEFAVYQITFIIVDITFVVYLAFATATSILFGQALGAKNLPKAKKIYSTSFWLMMISVVIVTLLIFIYRYALSFLFFNDAEIVALLSVSITIACITQLFNAYSFLATATLRVLQDYKYITKVNVIIFTIIGIPLCVGFPFIRLDQYYLGTAGFWLGFGIVVILSCFMLSKQIKYYFRISSEELLTLIDSQTKQGSLLSKETTLSTGVEEIAPTLKNELKTVVVQGAVCISTHSLMVDDGDTKTSNYKKI